MSQGGSLIRSDVIGARGALLALYAESTDTPELHAQRPTIKRTIDFLFDVLVFQNEAAYDLELTLEWLERADELLGQVRVKDAMVTCALADIRTDIGNAAVSVRAAVEIGAVTLSRNGRPHLIQPVAASEHNLLSAFPGH